MQNSLAAGVWVYFWDPVLQWSVCCFYASAWNDSSHGSFEIRDVKLSTLFFSGFLQIFKIFGAVTWMLESFRKIKYQSTWCFLINVSKSYHVLKRSTSQGWPLFTKVYGRRIRKVCFLGRSVPTKQVFNHYSQTFCSVFWNISMLWFLKTELYYRILMGKREIKGAQ